MYRITDKHLEAVITRINSATGSPATPYTRTGDKLTANIGNYHLSGAYGGVCLHRMQNEGGGVTTPLCGGHIPKRALYDQLHAFLNGIYIGQTGGKF